MAGRAEPEGDPEADPEAVARAICLRLLTGAPRTRAELARALARRAVPADAAEAVLDRFAEVGLIDDDAFAKAWVSTRQAGRGLARRALGHELRRRGIDQLTVQDALAGVDDAAELRAARALVARRARTTAGLAPAQRARRLGAMLARKGYPADVVRQAVTEALGDDRALDPS